MGILDRVKEATGVGLDGAAQYRRAFEKGVFMQPPDIENAIKQFSLAAERYLKEGNVPGKRLAEANSLLYRLVSKRNLDLIPDLLKSLENVPEIEQVGTQGEMVSGTSVSTELRAIVAELHAEAAPDLPTKSGSYKAASDLLMQLGNSPLLIAERLKLTGPTVSGMMRGFYNSALSDYHAAFAALETSPDEAQNRLHRAAIAFRQAQMKDWTDKIENEIDSVKSRRHCWICNRQMQGRDTYYSYLPARITRYHHQVVETLRQDTAMLDHAGMVSICSVCSSTVQLQADRYATERAKQVRDWVAPLLESHRQALTALSSRVDSLERRR